MKQNISFVNDLTHYNVSYRNSVLPAQHTHTDIIKIAVKQSNSYVHYAKKYIGSYQF